MAPDYTEVIELQRREAGRRGPSPVELAAHRQRQQTIAMKMEQLLAADEWTTFTAHVAALRERDEGFVESLRAEVERGALVGDGLARAMLQIQYLRGRLEGYRDALAIPKAVVEQAATEPAPESA